MPCQNVCSLNVMPTIRNISNTEAQAVLVARSTLLQGYTR